MVWIISFFTLAGINFSLWVIIGILRYTQEKLTIFKKEHLVWNKFICSPEEIACIVPAHNEEKTIKRTLKALLKVLPKKNIIVASDYSIDLTNAIVRGMDIEVFDIKPNIGKAKALVATIKKYNLLNKFKLILINDADTEIHPNYLNVALPYFSDKDISAVACHSESRLQDYNFWQKFFIFYRIKLWRILQLGLRWGQTWKYTNVSFIIPGSLSIYRTSVLKKIEIDAPNLIIEDFNMTFELHHKKLGKIAYSPKFIGIHQDPSSLKDYIKQVKRWNEGFFQTVKRHGFWPSFFFLSTTSYYIELIFYSLFLVVSPVLILLLLLHYDISLPIPTLPQHLTILDILIGIFLMDYLLTVFAAILEKKPSLLLYGLGFIFLRYIDSLIYLSSPFTAYFMKSTGIWNSPKRN